MISSDRELEGDTAGGKGEQERDKERERERIQRQRVMECGRQVLSVREQCQKEAHLNTR